MNFLGNLENFEKILLYHFKKYPLMTPKDAVKLVFQSAKGCGHLVKNGEFALSMLKNEMENTPESLSTELVEPIGGGYVRLYLAPAKARGISLDYIAKIFMESANSGETTDAEPYIKQLKKLAKEGKTPFSAKELSEFLEIYDGEMLSHSDIYRENYKPAYRVVLEKLLGDLQ